MLDTARNFGLLGAGLLGVPVTLGFHSGMQPSFSEIVCSIRHGLYALLVLCEAPLLLPMAGAWPSSASSPVHAPLFPACTSQC
jgi:hypothetical protein